MPDFKMITFADLLDIIKRGEGFTVFPNAIAAMERDMQVVNRGYAVALPIFNHILAPEHREDPNGAAVRIYATLDAAWAMTDAEAFWTEGEFNPRMACGGWLDNTTGDYEIAVVAVFDDKQNALLYARRLHQAFIGDLEAYDRGEDGDIPVPSL